MSFGLIAVALSLLGIGFIVAPLLWLQQQAGRRGPDANAVSVALFREQMDELEGQRQAGLIPQSDYGERKQELELRLLADAPGQVDADDGNTHSRGYTALVVVLALLVPLAAWFLYQQFGSGQAWQLTQRYQAISEQLAAGEGDRDAVMALVGDLAAFGNRHDSADWQFLQAQLSMQLGMFQAAAESYAEVAAQQPGNADILARQAQAMYLAAGRKLDTATRALIEQVLALNPRQSTVLGIRGMDAFEKADYALAIESWQQALAGLPAQAPSRAILEQGIRQARAAAPGADNDSAAMTAATGFSEGIKVRVELGKAAAASPGATVYVIASAPQGGMPFAVVRLPVEGLPAEVILDDSSAMAPGSSLSRQQQVRITARVSHSGNAIAEAGDWQGRSSLLTPDTVPEVVAIRIDQQI